MYLGFVFARYSEVTDKETSTLKLEFLAYNCPEEGHAILNFLYFMMLSHIRGFANPIETASRRASSFLETARRVTWGGTRAIQGAEGLTAEHRPEPLLGQTG